MYEWTIVNVCVVDSNHRSKEGLQVISDVNRRDVHVVYLDHM